MNHPNHHQTTRTTTPKSVARDSVVFHFDFRYAAAMCVGLFMLLLSAHLFSPYASVSASLNDAVDFVLKFSDQPVRDQYTAIVLFTGASFAFSAIVRETCTDVAARWAARAVGVAMFVLIVLFTHTLTHQVESLQQQCSQHQRESMQVRR